MTPGVLSSVGSVAITIAGHWAVLLDYGLTPGTTGIGISGTARPSGGVVSYQRFEVTHPGGWRVDSAEFFADATDPDGLGVTLALYAQTEPYRLDRGAPIGQATAAPGLFGAIHSASFGGVVLSPGVYFIGMTANGPNFNGGWYAVPVVNPQQMSLSYLMQSDEWVVQGQTMTLRLHGEAVPSPGAIMPVSALAGAVVVMRPRRR